MADVVEVIKYLTSTTPLLTGLLGAAGTPVVVSVVKWARGKAHARTPEGRAEAESAREAARQAEHWQTHDRSLAALARTRDELIEDIGRIRADRDKQAELHRAERAAWQAERAMLLEQQRAERESWLAERERILREVDHWETRFREVLEDFDRWKRESGYPVSPPQPGSPRS